MLATGVVTVVAIAIFGMLIYLIKKGEREKAVAETKLAIEQDAANKLQKANEIINTHSDPNDTDDSLRRGTF